MKKKRNKPQKRSRQHQPAPPQGAVVDAGRRAFLSRAGWGLGILGIVGGGSAFAVSAVRATAREQDLSRVGSGVPMVVQIHDPSCALCTALQKETRRALKGFDAADLDYAVANITTQEGGAFAARFGQPHVTLMLMDPEGKVVRVLNGPQESSDLRQIFEEHAAAYQ